MAMTKSYVKDTNGKYRLVDKQEPLPKEQMTEAKILANAFQELDVRLKRVESIVIGARK